LLAAFQEVSFRANRLREWTELEGKLLLLEMRFDAFDREAKDAPENMDNAKRDRLNRAWELCQETELLDIQAFADSLMYINRSSWVDGGIQSQSFGTAMSKADISSVLLLIEPIQNDLTGKDWGALVQHSAQFRKAVKGKILNNRALWRRELQELCALTIQLNSALAGTLVI
jgi:hypothetical protein